jgi:SAM-dependent methyltransferase
MATFGGSNRFTRLAYRAADYAGILLGQRDRLTPPAHMFADPHRVDGSKSVREFVSIGESTVRWLINLGMARTHRVLEIGCGIGRMAMPLTRHIRAGGPGHYWGVDITPEKIAYCKRTVTHVAPHFRFVHADVFNKYYNPRGSLRAAEYRFPFKRASFDFIFLTSVFTHMLPEDMEHYLAEIARLLVPGGKCVASFWITTEPLGEPYHRYSDVSWIFDPAEPEYGVYYMEPYVRACYARNGLDIDTLRYGTWMGRGDRHASSPQDVIIATKQRVSQDDHAALNEVALPAGETVDSGPEGGRFEG